MNKGKVMVFSMAKGRMGEEESSAYGKLLLNSIKNIAFQRIHQSTASRKPVYVMIDECHNFLSGTLETLLSECRKFGVHLIFASQHLAKFESRKMESEILSNTAVKIIGTNTLKTQKKLASEIDVKPDLLHALKKFEFLIKTGRRKPFVYRAKNYLVGKNNIFRLDASQVKSLKAQQVQLYYKKLSMISESPSVTQSEEDNTFKVESSLYHSITQLTSDSPYSFRKLKTST